MDHVLDEVKTALRVTHNKLDETSLLPLIEQARWDLAASGVREPLAFNDTHPLVTRAIIFYCRAHFETGGDHRESVRNLEAYEKIKTTLALLGGGLGEGHYQANQNFGKKGRFGRF